MVIAVDHLLLVPYVVAVSLALSPVRWFSGSNGASFILIRTVHVVVGCMSAVACMSMFRFPLEQSLVTMYFRCS